MINELYQKVTEIKLLTDSSADKISDELRKQVSRLCSAAAAELSESREPAPRFVSLFPLNEQETAAFSLAVPEEDLLPEPHEGGYFAAPIIGDIVSFGGYEWVVLHCDKESASCLIVSRDILFSSPLSQEKYSGWQDSQMRKWLNGAFLLSLGGDAERVIPVRTERSPEAVDSVFLLSAEEAEKLMPAEQRAAKLNWWLRTSGSETALAGTDGSISRGTPAANIAGIRPAMVISVASPLVKV